MEKEIITLIDGRQFDRKTGFKHHGQEIKQVWGKSSYENGLDLFRQSHASSVTENKVDSDDLTIISLDELLKEIDNNK